MLLPATRWRRWLRDYCHRMELRKSLAPRCAKEMRQIKLGRADLAADARFSRRPYFACQFACASLAEMVGSLRRAKNRVPPVGIVDVGNAVLIDIES